MNPKAVVFAFVSALLLTACGSDKSENMLLDAVKARAKAGFAAKQTGVPQMPALTRSQLQAIGQPIVEIAIPLNKVKALMAQLTANAGTQTFASPDGSMATYRGGVLISTRGVVGGLMSASVPSPATLARAGSSFERTHYILGDNDSIAPIVFSCTTAFVGTETIEIYEKSYAVRHHTETCEGPVGQIVNHYWFDSGSKIRMSKQWSTPTLAYFETKSVID